MDLSTTDERAFALAPRLDISAEGAEAVSWVNPTTGTVCRLERTGDYEVWRKVRMVMKPVVVSRLPRPESDQLLRNPYSETSRRAAASAIVAVDASAG